MLLSGRASITRVTHTNLCRTMFIGKTHRRIPKLPSVAAKLATKTLDAVRSRRKRATAIITNVLPKRLMTAMARTVTISAKEEALTLLCAIVVSFPSLVVGTNAITAFTEITRGPGALTPCTVWLLAS